MSEQKTVPPECKDCDKTCAIQFNYGMTTAMYFPPIYNKFGVNINPDGNKTTGWCMCTTCTKQWNYTTQYGNTTFEEKI